MSARFEITLKRRKGSVNLGKAKESIHARTRVAFESAVQFFVKALAEEVSKHIDTGMSMASIIPLARVAKVAEAIAFGHNPSKKGFTEMDGNYNRDGIKGVAAGIHAGARGEAFQILYGGPTRNVFRLWFSIRVFQYMLHEFGYQTAAWGSISKATNAFYEGIIRNRNKLPVKFRDFMEYHTDWSVR